MMNDHDLDQLIAFLGRVVLVVTIALAVWGLASLVELMRYGS